MAEWTKRVSRRKFLQTSAAAGVALSLPWLPGCGGDDGEDMGSPTPTPGPLEGRRQHDLHFDLSGFSDSRTFVLHAIGSKANKRHLTAHTAATRAEFRASTAPQGISDAQLTHFVKGVDLPASAVQHIWVTAGTEPSDALVLSKLFCGIDPNNPQTWISPRDTAIALIFHHNEIIRLDPDQAAIVCAHIEAAPLLELATILGKKGAFVAVPATDFDGNPVLGANGKQLVQHDPSDAVLAVADAVVRDVLQRVFDDPELEDANWHSASGFTVPVSDTTNLLSAEEDPLFEADYPADPHARRSVHGVYFSKLELVDPTTRTIELDVKNFWLRWLTAHVDFLTPDGFAVQSEEVPFLQGIAEYDLWGIGPKGGGGPVKARFLNAIGANNDVLGIPIPPEQVVETRLRFRMPPDASVARVMFLTLGLGGWSLPGEDNVEARKLPLQLTGIFNIGLPVVLLGLAVGINPLTVKSLAEIASDPFLWADLVRLVPSSIFKSIQLNDSRPFLIAFGSKLASLLLKWLPALAAKISALIAMEEVEEAVPVVGWGVKLVSIGAATAKLLQTVGEVFSGPSYFENKISVTLTTRLTIKHDPNDPAGWPATAAFWEAHASYEGKLGGGFRGRVPSVRTDPIVWEYGGVPSGGKAKMEVLLFSEDNRFLAGYGTMDFINLPGPGNVLTLEMAITENLVPLTANTRYHHNRKLAITNGRYTWQAAKDAPPTQTAADLVCDQEGLCDLNGITLNETTATVGYSWQALSPRVPLCTGGTSTTPVHRIQNVSFTPRAEERLEQALCGYTTGKPLLAYELRSAPGQGGRSFYLDPSGTGGGYHLRAVNLGASAFDQTSQMSWGQFSQQQNALAIHPAGYVAGINTQYHKLEILQLRESAAPDTEVAASVLKAGKGTRVGLLDTPYAVAVDLRSGAIYVLEGGNNRIQAFDVYGTPTARFAGGTKEVRLLHPDADVTYLDMAVESTGYIYVLSFVGGGRHPADYRLDIYDLNDGDQYLSRTTGVAAGKMAVDLWRNIFTLNYEPVIGPNGVEPSISEWIPST